MKQSTILHDVSPEQITSLFEELKNQIKVLNEKFEPKTPTEYLTRNEVVDMLKCDLSTLWLWTKKGKLTSYGIGNRTYYKRTEVENAIICLNKK
ncbi:MAG: helix-turn-helix domain-containing protein [Bacteroidia bacterium]|nr:helix-turn-helix domain-containing protein [Bacteroidia bacterium]